MHIVYFRRKRTIEYTRWRANEETTPEFLVKVLDEDVPPTGHKKIVAVNILPITKGKEKIIIGGAALPPSTTPVNNQDPFREYTRFVPPTTVPASSTVEMIFAPARKTGKRPLGKQKERHPQRDESPPANPQFLTRTPALRQYAPIAAVAFTKRASLSPISPPYNLDEDHAHTPSNSIPTRTSPMPDISLPTRTESYSEEYSPYQIFEDNDRTNLIFMTRTTFVASYSPVRSTLDKSLTDDESLIPIPRIYHTDIRRFEPKIKQNKESDASYNMMFYDDETDIKSHKGDDKTDTYDEKSKEDESSKSVVYDDQKEQSGNDLREAAAIKGIQEDIEIHDTSNISHFIETSSVANKDNVTDNNTTLVETKPASIMPLTDRFKLKHRQCNLTKIRTLAFNSPRTLYEIVAQLKQWADNSPVAKWVDITHGNYTTLDNPIYMMIVDDPTSGQVVSAKQTVMIVAGIQGRDHHAVAAAMYILYQLIERTSHHSDLLSKYRFWIIPVFNPDGYDYSITFPQRREWMKNLRQNWDICKNRLSCKSCENFGLRCTVQSCYGVNLDRNFEYQWIPTEDLRAEHPCGGLYAGTRQLSEPETQALTQYLHDQKVPLFTFIALKEGDVLGVLYPYSHTKKRRALDNVYRQRATSAAAAASSIHGRHYVAGQTSEYLPLYAGGIEDWIDGHLGVDNTYTIMMFRPSESYGTKQLTERVVHETFAAMDTLLFQSLESRVQLQDNVPVVNPKIRNAVTRCNTATVLFVLTRFALRILS
ncbi:uncharacterized protein LOC106141375 [Amyelois transitella]|uniref:uncharacterized protein LOC106141375 n=1 Tax=Amyelois transitella TaxID=680683 RepID=UPI00298F928B|nr:uncharacterized protein LOC106141375 [Amyelois transitella]